VSGTYKLLTHEVNLYEILEATKARLKTDQ